MKSDNKAKKRFEDIYIGAPLTAIQKKRKKTFLKDAILSFDPAKVKSVLNLVDSYKNMSIQARRIGQCASVYENMLKDKRRPTVLLGLAGPLIAGGLREVIRDMIAYGIVDSIVSTGAILYQDLYQALGNRHSKGTPYADDAVLRDHYINRIYDTYVDDEKFVKTDAWVSDFAGTLENRNYSSREFLYLLGKKIKDKKSILATASKFGVPIFSPALNDSSIGIGLTDYYHSRALLETPKLTIDAIRDNYELTQIVVKSKSTSAIYVAGGVPKNFINDSVVMGYIFGKNTGGHTYAFQLTTDVPHWGGLSGSTLEEAKSWGKVSTKAEKAMAFVEPTVSLPMIVSYVMQKGLWKKRRRLVFQWKKDALKKISPGQKV